MTLNRWLALTGVTVGLFVTSSMGLSTLQPAATAGTRAPTSTNGLGPFPAVSRPSDFRELAVAVRGRVGQVLVKPGDRVSPQDLLLALEDSVQRRTIELAALGAADDSALRNAELTAAYWAEEVRLTQESRAQGGASETEIRDAQLRAGQSALSVEQTRRELEEARIAHARELDRLEEMRVVSPISGIVLDVHKRPGETADEQTKVITVISTDPLWLEVNVPTREALALGVGQAATVVWQDIGSTEAMPGKIIFISPAGHGGARQVQVRVEVPNPSGLPSGLHGDVVFAPALTAQAGGNEVEGLREEATGDLSTNTGVSAGQR